MRPRKGMQRLLVGIVLPAECEGPLLLPAEIRSGHRRVKKMPAYIRQLRHIRLAELEVSRRAPAAEAVRGGASNTFAPSKHLPGAAGSLQLMEPQISPQRSSS